MSPSIRGPPSPRRIVLGGHVIHTDSVVVEIVYDDGPATVTLHDVDETLLTGNTPPEEGNHVTAFGTLTDESTLDVDRSLTRVPREVQYMYVISFLDGRWLLGSRTGGLAVSTSRTSIRRSKGSCWRRVFSGLLLVVCVVE